ncbi:MAG: hypothetical protein ACXWXP_07225 [Actinomycetota bacterium]
MRGPGCGLPWLGARTLASITTALLLAAGCTGETPPAAPSMDFAPTDGPAAEVPSADDPAAEEPTATPEIGTGMAGTPGRLAVLDELGSLVTFDPDGSNVVVVAESVQGESLVRQPTWSPDGDRIAWVRLAVAAGVDSALVTTAPDGTGPTEVLTTVIPFYLSWDPTSSRIAYLGSSSTADIELGVVEAGGGGEATALDAGSPLYVSWSPAGDQLLVHVGRDRLDRLEIDGTTTSVDARPGTFNVPVWTSDGGSLVFASAAGGRQRLLAHDLERGRAETLVRFDGGITFVVSPDGRRVAFQVARSPDDVGPLSVLDRQTGVVERVATDIVPAFFWSPDGTRLLSLLPERTPSGFAFRWGVWDGGSSFTTARFYPTDVFARDYLQFFEQYAQSMSLWAPDGSAFTYAGTNESGETGIWIQPAQPDAEPVLMTGGVFASWSPA